MTNPAEHLVDLLDLEPIEVSIFRGRSPEESLQRVFGGQVAGQALVAAGRTTDGERPVHSLHAYFLRPGRPGVPIVYQVERVRDGRSFTTRRVTAVQEGRTIFNLTASFHRPEEAGFEHQLPPARIVPDPEELPTVAEEVREHLGALPQALERMARRQPSTSATSTGCAGRRTRSGRRSAQRGVDAGGGPAGRRPAGAHLRADVRERHDAAGRGPYPGGAAVGSARLRHGVPGPCHVVPPAVPGGRVVPVRPGVADRDGRPGAWHGGGSTTVRGSCWCRWCRRVFSGGWSSSPVPAHVPGSGSWSTSWRRVRMSGGAGCSWRRRIGPRPARRESARSRAGRRDGSGRGGGPPAARRRWPSPRGPLRRPRAAGSGKASGVSGVSTPS